MKLYRKEFISLSGAGLAALAGSSVLSMAGCSGIRRDDLPKAEPGDRLKNSLGEKRCAVLYHASLAPSPHNTQPWYVKILDGNRWIVGADQSRRMTTTDPNNHRLVLALGAFVENLTLAAGALGFHVDSRVLSENFFGDDIVSITLRESEPVPYPLQRILLRKTVKNGYRDRTISGGHLRELSEPLAGHFFYFPRGNWHADCIRNGAVDAFRSWLDSREAQAEHVRWLRIRNADARQKRDGLTTEGMEIKGVTGWCVRTFISDEMFAGDFMKGESMKFVRKTASEGGGYAIVSGYGRSVAGMIELGRRFERMALTARDLGIGIQPMTQMLEMPSGRELVRSNHGPSIDPQLVLRVGYVDNYPGPVTLRRPVEHFVRYM